MVNWDGDIEWSGVNEVNKVEDLVTDTSKLKQFGTGKKLNITDKLKAEQKNKYQQKLQEDTMEQINYIENKRGGFGSMEAELEETARVSGAKLSEANPETLLQNLPKEYHERVLKESLKKTKKASGGSVDYDNYLPNLDDMDY